MATEIRFAVRRTEKSVNRRMWWNRKADRFEPGWEQRTLWDRKAGALAVLWVNREQEDHNNYYTFTIVRVTRKYRDSEIQKPVPTRTENVAPIP